MTLLQLYDVASLQAEVRELASERDAVILAHNYQLPEIQDVADYVGDSLGLSQQAARAWRPAAGSASTRSEPTPRPA